MWRIFCFLLIKLLFSLSSYETVESKFSVNQLILSAAHVFAMKTKLNSLSLYSLFSQTALSSIYETVDSSVHCSVESSVSMNQQFCSLYSTCLAIMTRTNIY